MRAARQLCHAHRYYLPQCILCLSFRLDAWCGVVTWRRASPSPQEQAVQNLPLRWKGTDSHLKVMKKQHDKQDAQGHEIIFYVARA